MPAVISDFIPEAEASVLVCFPAGGRIPAIAPGYNKIYKIYKNKHRFILLIIVARGLGNYVLLVRIFL